MSAKTGIQWTDTTVNPVMGCDGCPLFPPPEKVLKDLAAALRENLAPGGDVSESQHTEQVASSPLKDGMDHEELNQTQIES